MIDSSAQTIRLRGAVEIGRSPTFTLWQPRGRPRFALYALGFVPGWIGPRGKLTIWPERADGRLAGFLSFRVRAVGAVGANKLFLTLPGVGKQTIELPVGRPRLIRIPVCSAGPWSAKFLAHVGRTVGEQLVSARASSPLWREDPGACVGTRRARIS